MTAATKMTGLTSDPSHDDEIIAGQFIQLDMTSHSITIASGMKYLDYTAIAGYIAEFDLL